MIRLFIFFVFLFSPLSGIFQQQPQHPEINVKWYIRKDPQLPGRYTVTIDTRKVNRYIQLSSVRFVAEFVNRKGDLIGRDTIAFAPQRSGGGSDSQTHLSGGKIFSMNYRNPKGPDVKLTGLKLLYRWDDSSISLEPDPIEEKAIIPALVYGEGSADISKAP